MGLDIICIVFVAVFCVLGLLSGFLSQVYLADLNGSPPRQLTTGEASSYAPQWSPDGQSIAYLSRNNIWLISLLSGNTRQLTDVPTSVSSFKNEPRRGNRVFILRQISKDTLRSVIA